jgi:DNA ligase D
MSLKKYQTKRNFKQTTEPKGKIIKRDQSLIFVVQKHAASHLHYDFRLELNGVLLSWAIPKGPSLDPGIKRLAVHVEDHPIEYADFEGTIPKSHDVYANSFFDENHSGGCPLAFDLIKNQKKSLWRRLMKNEWITHPDKILYPGDKISKGEIADYYVQIHEWILPHLLKRPLTLVRCPDGIDHSCFFQKHADNKNKSIHIHDTWIYIDNLEGLLNLIQMGTLEIHVWGCTLNNLEKPDRIIFDLDPDEGLSWATVKKAAVLVKKELESIGLQSFLKTTGGKGLHIVIPIFPKEGWTTIKDFSHAISKHLESQYPDIFISNMSKEKRKGKIFLDYLRNSRGATAIAAFSTRARTNPTVSVPLRWDELSSLKKSNYYTIHNLPKRLKTLKTDPWEGFFDIKQNINI